MVRDSLARSPKSSPARSRPPAVLLAVAGILAISAVPAIAGASLDGHDYGRQDGVRPAVSGPFGLQVDADVVVMHVNLTSEGDARWTVEHRIRLANDSERQAFGDLAADVEANETVYRDRFRTRMAPVVQDASAATGRQMSISGISVAAYNTTFPQEYGVVEFHFRWSNFSAVEGDELRAGDALAGFFLDSETRLRLSWPSGYELRSISPPPDDDSRRVAVWEGPQDFGESGPEIVLTPAGRTPGNLVLLAALGLVLLVVLAIASVKYPEFSPLGAVLGDASGPDRAGTDDGESGEGDGPPWELLSNDEQVLKLLDRHDGRIKQQEIAGKLEWTDAKTSQVVGSMREDGAVETFRIGRENVVTFPDRDLVDDYPNGAEGSDST